MDSSGKQESLPPPSAFSHRRPFLYHQCLELSPHCQLHGGYLLHPNSHHNHHSATAHNHHHHHLELSPDCPLHGYLLPYCPLHTSNSYSTNQSTTNFPNFAPTIPPPRNPQLFNPNLSNFNNLNSIPPESGSNSKSEALLMQERNEQVEDDEEEFIYVLTDEWKEFFAKSEAKRRLAKKQAKKKPKD